MAVPDARAPNDLWPVLHTQCQCDRFWNTTQAMRGIRHEPEENKTGAGDEPAPVFDGVP
jgi:hypothetical protein